MCCHALCAVVGTVAHGGAHDGRAVGEHSEKPERVLEMIEAYFPTLPKIELNRRGAARAGGDAWGNEVESNYCNWRIRSGLSKIPQWKPSR